MFEQMGENKLWLNILFSTSDRPVTYSVLRGAGDDVFELDLWHGAAAAAHCSDTD